MMKVKKLEQGSAEIRIVLENAKIEVIHGEADVVLAYRENAPEGSWNKLWDFLVKELGVERL